MELVTLRRGESEAVIAPGIGGGILSWTDRGQAMLRPAQPDALRFGLPRGLGAYPLVPFSNRIEHGVFEFAGHRYELPAISDGHAIHGVGWKHRWTVTGATADTATIALHHPAGELWPFAFDAEQRFVLGDTGLTWSMRVTNRHDRPAPAGIGFHPYFPRGGGLRLQFQAAGVWFNGPDSIPMRHASVPAEWDHSEGRAVGSTIIDNCFTGWRSPALLDYGTHTLTVSADALFRFFIAYTPEHKDFFAIEPVSHMNDGVNRMHDGVDHGIHILNPGAALQGEVHMALARR